MKDFVRQILETVTGDVRKVCILREYLQVRILQSLQEEGVFSRWAFLGGTALRLLYGMPRFSEDLDFSLVRIGRDPGFEAALRRCRSTFESEGYRLNIKAKCGKAVASSFVRFPGLLHELDLSPDANQALSVKIELDTNPPGGAGVETTIVRRHVTLHLQHYDKASLLAGKLHAVLSRRWCKGRDLYDLIWYLADRTWPAPNLPMLNAALAQTGWKGPVVDGDNWRRILRTRLQALDWNQARADVQPFLDRDSEVRLIHLDSALSVLGT